MLIMMLTSSPGTSLHKSETENEMDKWLPNIMSLVLKEINIKTHFGEYKSVPWDKFFIR